MICLCACRFRYERRNGGIRLRPWKLVGSHTWWIKFNMYLSNLNRARYESILVSEGFETGGVTGSSNSRFVIYIIDILIDI